MVRVLHVMSCLCRGGLETFVMNCYRAIDKSHIQFDFLLSQAGGDYEEEARSLGANIYVLPNRSMLDKFFMDHHDYVAIHEHISWLFSLRITRLAKKYGIPIRIYHSHSSSIPKNLRLWLIHYILHYLHKPIVRLYATHYFGCSDKALDWMYNGTGIRSKAVMLKNGIDCGEYAFDEDIRKQMRIKYGIGFNDFVIGHVGKFIPLKNQTFLVDILDCLVKQTNAKLILVGDGPTQEDIKNKCISKGLADRVVFTGVCSEVNKVLQAIDVIVMPSWFEGLPVSLVEAQAAGLPIVASDTISRDTDLTGTILFKSLDDSAEEWSRNIVEWYVQIGRSNNIEKLKENGYDSVEIANYLSRIYLQ